MIDFDQIEFSTRYQMLRFRSALSQISHKIWFQFHFIFSLSLFVLFAMPTNSCNFFLSFFLHKIKMEFDSEWIENKAYFNRIAI